ncbi:MAG: hypothetical protein ACP5U2_17305, partial [Bryobacteraceae bacterium]
ARADILTYGFQCITNNTPANCAIGEAQLFMDVVGAGQTVNIGGKPYTPTSGQVLFRFFNTGPWASVIAAVYFDYPQTALFPSAPFIININGTNINGTGVSFDAGGTPLVLPGGNNLTPPFQGDYRATAKSPRPKYGVGPGEDLGFLFTLASGKSWDDVIGALDSHQLRVGLHVQSIGTNSESESFVNNGVVPEPAAILLVGSVLLILGRKLRAGPRGA